jgi:RNA polymerase sigma-70 factor, ECF subfamily
LAQRHNWQTWITTDAMGTDVDRNSLPLDHFRDYLCAIARLQVAARPWVAAKLDASDLVQQTLLRAHEAREQFRGKSAEELAAWLRTILSHVLANGLRTFGQAKRDVGVERSLDADLDASGSRLDAWLAADQSSPSEAAGSRERAAVLAEAVATLPKDQREVVLAKHCLGLSLEEISQQTGRTSASVAGLLRRGLRALREQLDGNRP